MKDRVIFLDYLRLIACFMVMLVHSCEPFYLGGQGTFIASEGDAFWVTAIDSALRPCIGLFVLASSYLMLPLKYDTRTFARKRLKRVVLPFVVWSLMYAFVPLYGSLYEFYSNESILTNLANVMLNFVGVAGHLWFVYMLLGLYLIMPILSPWLSTVSKRGERAFLILWAFTTLVPFLRVAANHLYGLPQVWGEANWNEFGTLYYVSGFVGFLVLGHYFRRYVGPMSWGRTLLIAVPLWVAGYAITAYFFYAQIPASYPVDAPIDLAVSMELTWGFTTTGVVMMTIAYFLIIRKLTSTGAFYRTVVAPVSRLSYGMYLMHIFFLAFYCVVVRDHISSTPLAMITIATATYVTSFVVSWTIEKIPVVGKYIVG